MSGRTELGPTPDLEHETNHSVNSTPPIVMWMVSPVSNIILGSSIYIVL